jgi:hypothetical protein
VINSSVPILTEPLPLPPNALLFYLSDCVTNFSLTQPLPLQSETQGFDPNIIIICERKRANRENQTYQLIETAVLHKLSSLPKNERRRVKFL